MEKRVFLWKKPKKDDEARASSSKPNKPRVSSRVLVAAKEPPKPERELFFGEDIPGEETHDDIYDYLGYLTYMAEVAKEEGSAEQLPVHPENINNEGVMRLAVLVSQQLEPHRPHPSYTSAIMPADSSGDEAVRMAMEASAPPPAVMPAVAASPASVIAMDVTALNWPSPMAMFVNLTQSTTRSSGLGF
jgi:hypothetical protein